MAVATPKFLPDAALAHVGDAEALPAGLPARRQAAVPNVSKMPASVAKKFVGRIRIFEKICLLIRPPGMSSSMHNA
jgi:hypothetical protein